MNTFVCDPDFATAAHHLSRAHCGKQRLEVWQMLGALRGESRGWSHHPAVRAWSGHERALAAFGVACHAEWISRGYVDTTMGRLVAVHDSLPDTGAPWWVEDPVYTAHVRSVLVGKDPAWYGRLWPAVAPLEGTQWWPSPTRELAA